MKTFRQATTQNAPTALAANNARQRRGQRGQAMVEMAFVLPLFLGLIFATIEIGRAWAAKHALTQAAREGARVLTAPYGADLPYASESAAQAAATSMVRDYLNSAGIAVTPATQITVVRVKPGNDGEYGTGDDQLEENYSNGQRGERVGIRIRHSFETPLPFILGLFNDPSVPQNPSNTIQMGVQSLMTHE